MTDDQLDAQRLETLRLRARVVVLERSVLACLELVLRMRPEALELFLEMSRQSLSQDYEDLDFAPHLTDPAERAFMTQEVQRLMRGVQADMGFRGGESIPEQG